MLKAIVKFVDLIVEKLNSILPPVLVQFGVYAGIGVLGAILDIGSFALLNKTLGVMYLIAFPIGKFIGIVNNFTLNVIFNFKTSDNISSRFLKFLSIALIGVIVGSGCMYIAVNLLKFNSLYSNIVITFLIALFQFFFNKLISFKK